MAQYAQSRGRVQNRRQKRRKEIHPFRNFLLWVLALAILVGAVFFFLANFHEDTKEKLEKMNYPIEYSQYVNKASKDYNIPPELIYAVIHTESRFDPNAKSGAGAYGLMQIMPSSFDWLMQKRGEEGKYTTDDLFKPEVNIDFGSYLLKYFYDYYGNEKCAVAAYNAGFVVGDWLEDRNLSSDGKTLDAIPYPETENYVERVEHAKEMYKKLYFS